MTEEEVVERYRGFVYHHAHHLAPVELDDAVQDGYIGLLLAFRRYDPDAGGNLDGWLYVAVGRAIIDGLRVRHHSRRKDRGGRPALDVISLDALDDFERYAVTEDDTLDRLLAEDLEAWLRSRAPLGVQDRRILNDLLDGRTQDAIAREAGVTPAAICHHVRVIRAAIAPEVVG